MKSKKILKTISIMLSCLILLSNTHYIYASSKINTNNKSDIKEGVVYLKDGQILKLIGTVSYTNYDIHTDKSPLPLFIR